MFFQKPRSHPTSYKLDSMLCPLSENDIRIAKLFVIASKQFAHSFFQSGLYDFSAAQYLTSIAFCKCSLERMFTVSPVIEDLFYVFFNSDFISENSYRFTNTNTRSMLYGFRRDVNQFLIHKERCYPSSKLADDYMSLYHFLMNSHVDPDIPSDQRPTLDEFSKAAGPCLEKIFLDISKTPFFV